MAKKEANGAKHGSKAARFLGGVLTDLGKVLKPSEKTIQSFRMHDSDGHAIQQPVLRNDPVCGANGNFRIYRKYKEKDYYFCSGGCQWRFIKDPENFAR